MEIRSVAPSSVAGAADKATPAPELGAAAKAVAAPVQKAALVQQPDEASRHEQLKQALEHLNRAMRNQSTNLEFSLEEGSDRPIVKVTDKNTGEVIRQMPSKEALEIAHAIDRMQSLLLNQKA